MSTSPVGGEFRYTVRASCSTPALAAEFADWLRGGHVAEVVASGALSAEVLLVDASADSPSSTCEVRYRFTDRNAFQAYERDHAPRLREEGRQRFPADRGITFTRSTAVLVR